MYISIRQRELASSGLDDASPSDRKRAQSGCALEHCTAHGRLVSPLPRWSHRWARDSLGARLRATSRSSFHPAHCIRFGLSARHRARNAYLRNALLMRMSPCGLPSAPFRCSLVSSLRTVQCRASRSMIIQSTRRLRSTVYIESISVCVCSLLYSAQAPQDASSAAQQLKAGVSRLSRVHTLPECSSQRCLLLVVLCLCVPCAAASPRSVLVHTTARSCILVAVRFELCLLAARAAHSLIHCVCAQRSAAPQ